MAKNLSSTLRGANYGTLPVLNGGTGITSAGTSGNFLTSNGSSWVSAPFPTSLTLGAGLTVGATLSIPSGDTSSRPTAVAGNLRFNTSTSSFEGYNGAAWGAIGGSLNPTAIKIANGYIAAASDLVRCNTSGGAFSISFPALPADGDVIGVLDTTNSFATKNLTVLANGKTIEGDSTSIILDVNGTYATFIYVSSTSNWKLQSIPKVYSATSTSTKTISNQASAYTVVASDLGKIINCTSGTFTVGLTAAASLGSGFTCTIWNTSNTSTDAITIDPNLTETIDGVATLVLRRGEGLAIVCNGTNWQIDDKKPMRGYAENISSSSDRPIATGNDSVSLGGTSSGNYSVSIGGNCSGTYSIAIGKGNNACSSSYGVALGAWAVAGGTYGSVSIGYGSSATVSYGTALGAASSGSAAVSVTGAGAMALGGSYASGTDSFAAAIGDNTSTYGAQGANSIALGATATASASSSIAIGNSTLASGLGGIAIGYIAQATGGNALSIGYSVSSSGQGAICIGNISASNGVMAVAIGNNVNASSNYSVSLGYQSKSLQIGKYTFASGYFSAQGDAQYGKIVLRKTTSDNTPTDLTSNAGGPDTTNQIILPNDSTYAFTILVVARRTDADNESAGYEFKGVIDRNTTAASTALVGPVIKTVLAEDTTAWECNVTAHTSNGGLSVTVTGESGKSIRWVATVHTTEVTG
jgi:hypothetical protein